MKHAQSLILSASTFRTLFRKHAKTIFCLFVIARKEHITFNRLLQLVEKRKGRYSLIYAAACFILFYRSLK